MLTQEISVEDKAANDKDDIIGKSERGYAVEDAQQLHQQRRTLRQQIEGTGFLLRTLLQSSNLSVTDNQQVRHFDLIKNYLSHFCFLPVKLYKIVWRDLGKYCSYRQWKQLFCIWK